MIPSENLVFEEQKGKNHEDNNGNNFLDDFQLNQ